MVHFIQLSKSKEEYNMKKKALKHRLVCKACQPESHKKIIIKKGSLF